ncbi:hypothetical protein JB92DRAFT_2864241 [Gautieria morchelliformis]|nr:hypothetical protein JB92DRAFT_2864241 [Gautieria morchelliformis]
MMLTIGNETLSPSVPTLTNAAPPAPRPAQGMLPRPGAGNAVPLETHIKLADLFRQIADS